MKLVAILILSFICFWTGAQEKRNLFEVVAGADSIIAIRHINTSNGDIMVVDRKGNYVQQPNLTLFDGQINDAVIEERVRLSDTEIEAFKNILIAKTGFSIRGMNFDPHHTILIYSKKKMSYIDMCFECQSHVASLDLANFGFDETQWSSLQDFFKNIALIEE